jgi:regulatory protein
MDAFDKAVSYLSLQPRTVKEIREYLKKKEYSISEIDDAIEKLREYRYLDDVVYGVSFIRQAAGKGWGKNKIDRSLMEKGVSCTDVETAWTQLEENSQAEDANLFNEKKRALEIAVKITRQHLADGKELDEKFFARVGRRLAGQGYSADTVYFVLNKLRGLKR